MNTRLHFHDFHPTPSNMRTEVLAGLSQPQKRIPPKFFYDREGSRLFDAITELPEYYPTRTEIGILEAHGGEMADLVGCNSMLVELGSGSSRKIHLLLDALAPALYMPIDISREHLLDSARTLAECFPELEVHAVCADYSVPFEPPVEPEGLRRLCFFPGSSIGNFEPEGARRFLERIGVLVGRGGKLLIGVDLLKDPAILDAAYNDAQGVTAAFNLNLLRRINRELDGDFDLDRFSHRAFFNEHEARVEMHLVSRGAQQVVVAGRHFSFRDGETLHTENSHKYSLNGFRSVAAAAGWSQDRVWTDRAALFSVQGLSYQGL